VLNATGVILHTNLGRAPLPKSALDAIAAVASGYSTLEYQVETGERGSRHSHVEDLLTDLTGAESAMVVNNNAAGILLALSAIAASRDVIVSRGELVEIGGSFRVPDVLELSGCHLVEVGTTNKTHAVDYAAVIDPERTGALLRVHTSNFKIIGFTAAASLAELSAIAKKHNLPLIEDLGSAAMIDLGIHEQPIAAASIQDGADVVTFSADKLLGGPQAGIVIGKAEYIEKMKRHPMARAMRIDKLSLAALEATLRLYLDPASVAGHIPTLQMLSAKPDALEEKAHRLCAKLATHLPTGCARVVIAQSQMGGGALPGLLFPSFAVALTCEGLSPEAIERHFRHGNPPIIGRIAQDQFLLDVRCLFEEDFAEVEARVAGLA